MPRIRIGGKLIKKKKRKKIKVRQPLSYKPTLTGIFVYERFGKRLTKWPSKKRKWTGLEPRLPVVKGKVSKKKSKKKRKRGGFFGRL